jgi:Galactose oxidase, central domain/Kelch motif
MKRCLLLLVLLGGACLLNACGGSSGSGYALPTATHFSLIAPGAANAGTDFTFTVTALDDTNNDAGSYSGTVSFTSTDGKAVLPGNVVLVSGSGEFHATLETVGMQTVTATDIAKTAITGSTNSIKVTAGATSLSVSGPSGATAGKAFSLTVTALDVVGKPFPNYAGTVTFTSTDGQAVLPSNSRLTNGTGSSDFSVTLETTGNQTITATDVATPSLTATSTSIHVSPPASGFTPTGNMSNAREQHTATLLNDGEVLVVGGDAWQQPPCPVVSCRPHYVPLASAELFDPASGSFTRTGNMATPRTQHAATLLGDGKVLVTGGDNRLSTAEIFDSSTGVFTPTGNMVNARAGHTATLLPNGKVLLAGGFGSDFNAGTSTAELFDPATGVFTATGSMGTSRTNGTATLLKNGDVLVTGGDDASGNPVGTAELFDPTTGMFTPTGSMSVARAWHTATLLASGEVLVTGGISSSGGNIIVTATAELFDPATGAFVLTGSMESLRELHTATKRTDGKVLVTGGLSGTGDLSTAELFDPVTGVFTHAGNMEIERSAHTATLLMNGEVLVSGGSNADMAANSGSLASAELFP